MKNLLLKNNNDVIFLIKGSKVSGYQIAQPVIVTLYNHQAITHFKVDGKRYLVEREEITNIVNQELYGTAFEETKETHDGEQLRFITQPVFKSFNQHKHLDKAAFLNRFEVWKLFNLTTDKLLDTKIVEKVSKNSANDLWSVCRFCGKVEDTTNVCSIKCVEAVI